MDNDRLIIILLGIIVVMLIVGVFMFMPSIFGQNSNILINSMDSIDIGGQFTLQLTDENGNPIINQEIDVTFKTADGVSSTKNVVTDSSGMGYVQLGTYLQENMMLIVNLRETAPISHHPHQSTFQLTLPK